MNAKQWVGAFAERVGADPPSAAEFKTILELAGVAAHSSERVAAPVACWLSAKAGLEPEEALRIAEEISPEAKKGP